MRFLSKYTPKATESWSSWEYSTHLPLIVTDILELQYKEGAGNILLETRSLFPRTETLKSLGSQAPKKNKKKTMKLTAKI